MRTTGGLTITEGGFVITPPPPPMFYTFGGAYLTNVSNAYYDSAINSDGTVFVAGAPDVNKVFVYSRSSTTWTLQQTITGTGYFGIGVSISADGCLLFIGNQSGNGKLYSRANTGSNFSSVFNTSASRADEPEISSDGTAFAYPTGNPMVLKLGKISAGTWSEICTYTLVSNMGNWPKVSMNSDGSRIACGFQYEQISGSQKGQVQILSWGRTATVPTIIQTISEPAPVLYNEFGRTVDMSPDGNTLVITSRYDHNVLNANAIKGAAYVYTWNGSQYTLQQSIIGTNSGDKLAQNSALGGDVLILSKSGTPNQYLVYTRTGSTWSLFQTTTLPTGFTSQSSNYKLMTLSSDGKQSVISEITGTPRFVYYYQGG